MWQKHPVNSFPFNVDFVAWKCLEVLSCQLHLQVVLFQSGLFCGRHYSASNILNFPCLWNLYRKWARHSVFQYCFGKQNGRAKYRLVSSLRKAFQWSLFQLRPWTRMPFWVNLCLGLLKHLATVLQIRCAIWTIGYSECEVYTQVQMLFFIYLLHI